MLQIKPYIIGCTQPSILQKDRMNEIKSNSKLECSFPYRMINKVQASGLLQDRFYPTQTRTRRELALTQIQYLGSKPGDRSCL